MATPTFVGTDSGYTATATSHTIQLPPFEVDDLVMVYMIVSKASVTMIPPSGWTALFGKSWGAADMLVYAVWRKIDGTEGFSYDGTDTITVSTSAGAASAHISRAYRETGDPPTYGGDVSGYGRFPNPGPYSPGFTKDYLWEAVGFQISSGGGYPGYPTGYTIGQTYMIQPDPDTPAVVVAAKATIAAATEDPAAITFPNNGYYISLVVAIWSLDSGGGWGVIPI